MSNSLPHIMNRVLNQPLLMDPAYARTFFAALASRMGIQRLQDLSGEIEGQEKLRVRAEAYTPNRERERPYRVIDGIAVLPVDGTLVNKFGHVRPYSGMTGYDGILTRAADAFNDPSIRGVLMDSDTPGGDAAGCFDCTRSLREMATAAGKPFWSLAYDMSCSGGMALASAADRRLITSTGYVGSVGVIMAHANYEKSLEEEGVDVTLIYAGAHKADGNPYKALSDEVYERFLRETESLRNEFAELVAGNIGMSVADVLATEALSYRGQEAINAGLADQLVNGNQAVQIFSEYLSSQGRTLSLGASMSKQDKTAEAAESALAESAASAAETTTNADQGELKKQAVAEERARITGILNCEEARSRQSLANHLATETELSVDAAKAMLSAAAEETPAAQSSNALDQVMSAESEPDIGLDAGDESAEDVEVSTAVSLYNKARGIKS